MTPRGFDRNVVIDRLAAMRRLLDQLDQLYQSNREDLLGDYGRQLQVERIVSALVDLAVAVNAHVAVTVLGAAPRDMKSSFTAVAEAGALDAGLAEDLVLSVGLRNVLVHAYLNLDRDILVAAVPQAREQYGAYVRQVARWLQSQDDDAGIVP
jgi:uncharacterized protein YutE (UPF0331/DUF86 family)